jgi:hypothetical protein
MKRFITFIFCFALLCGSYSTLLAQDGGNIDIEFGENTGNNVPNRSSYVPVEAVYIGALSTIAFTFSQNLGTVSIIVSNAQTGEYIATQVNTNLYPLETVPVSGDAGLYTIQVCLADGTMYYGEFELY